MAGLEEILTGTLKGFDVLRTLSKLGDGLHESDSRFLVGLKGRKNGSGHFKFSKVFKFEL
jgi:hypothetical protein